MLTGKLEEEIYLHERLIDMGVVERVVLLIIKWVILEKVRIEWNMVLPKFQQK